MPKTPKPRINDDELVKKLKTLRTGFERDFAVLEKSLLEVRKDLQTKIDKKKLAAVKKSF